MSDMTINEARGLKEMLEVAIADAIDRYQRSTGITVVSVDVQALRTIGGNMLRPIIEVQVAL